MKTFDDYSLEEKLAHFTDVGRRALPLWGLPEDSDMKLLNFTENATFLLTAPGSDVKTIMRVHRLDYTSRDSIMTELTWIMDLKRETDVSLALPIPMKNGEYVASIHTDELNEDRLVDCSTFMPGKPPMDSSDGNGDVGDMIAKIEKIPDSITLPLFKTLASAYAWYGSVNSKSHMTEEDRAMYREVGRIMAEIHVQSQHWKKPPFYDRIEWDFDGTFGKWNNFYGATYRSAKWLSEKEIAVLDEVKEEIRERLALYGESREHYGMIHSDLRTANLLKDGATITVLDFDDCGMGFYMYDVAGAVALMEHRPDLMEIVDEILKGYEPVRHLTGADKEEIPTFIMMRRIGMLQSLICRIGCVAGGSGEACELTAEILEFYARGTVELGKKYLKEYGTPDMALVAMAV